jgi:DNA-binding cell septation regulator SpoVG
MEVVRVYKPEETYGNVIAFFDIETAGFRINGFRLVDGDYNNYIRMPARKGKNNRWWPVAYPADKETKEALKRCIIDALKDVESRKIVVEKQDKEPEVERRRLTKEEKITISRDYMPPQWASDEDTKRMRRARYGDMRQRGREF